MTVYHVKGYLRTFLRVLDERIKQGDYIGAARAIMALKDSNTGKGTLNWLAAALCLPGMEGQYPEINGDIYEELEGFGDLLHDYQLFIKPVVMQAVIEAAKK